MCQATYKLKYSRLNNNNKKVLSSKCGMQKGNQLSNIIWFKKKYSCVCASNEEALTRLSD